MRQQWEYLKVFAPHASLYKLGRDGWELVGITSDHWLYFKRPMGIDYSQPLYTGKPLVHCAVCMKVHVGPACKKEPVTTGEVAEEV